MQRRDDLASTYSTEEDALIWRHQASLRSLRLRGSRLLGGFLVHEHLLAMLPVALPRLTSIELVRCFDLTPQHLAALAASGAARTILVDTCRAITGADCRNVAAQLAVTEGLCADIDFLG
jgi:hypothetical protein